MQDLEGNKRTVKVVSKGSAVQIPLPSEEDKIIQEIDDLLNSILGQGGVKINSDEEEDGVEVNSVTDPILYQRYNELTNELGKTSVGIKLRTKCYQTFNKLKNYDLEYKNKYLEQITVLSDKYKSNNIKLINDTLNFLIVGISIDIDDYLRNSLVERKKQEQEVIDYYTSIGLNTILDITGLKSTGVGIGTVIAYWEGYINNNIYLEEASKNELKESLKSVGLELNPVKK